MTQIDGKGRIVFGSIDEFGLKIYSGKFNEFGHFVKGGRLFTVILTEALHIVDSFDTQLIRILSESVISVSSMGKTSATHYLTEALHVVDTRLASINKTLQENLYIAIDKSTKLTTTMFESVLLSVPVITKLNRTLQEHLHISILSQLARSKYLIEHVHISDRVKREFTIPRMEHVHIAVNKFKTTVTRPYIQHFHISDLLNKARSISFIEYVHISDIRKAKVTRTIRQPFVITTSKITKLTRRLHNELIHIVDQYQLGYGMILIEHLHIAQTMSNWKIIRTIVQPFKIIATFSGRVPFVMTLMSTKLKTVYKGSQMLRQQLSSKVKQIYRGSESERIESNSKASLVHEDTEVSLNDGRELR